MDEHEFVLNFGALLPGYEVTGFRRLHGYRIAKSSTYLAIYMTLTELSDQTTMTMTTTEFMTTRTMMTEFLT